MANNEILERFSQVEKQAGGTFSDLEAYRADDHIHFRMGKARFRIMRHVVPVVYAVLAALVSSLQCGTPWSPEPWCIAAFIYVVIVMFVFRNGAERFVLDTPMRTIHITMSRREKSIDLNNVACFLARYAQSSDEAHGRIYAVDHDGAETELADCAIEADMERNACILGFVCGKPAYRIGERGTRLDILGSLKSDSGTDLRR